MSKILLNKTQSLRDLPIGVFDSGVGGLTVLRGLKKELPNEHFIYLGDTARLPYGTKSQETVTRYSQHACNILLKRGIKCLVVACNTATTLALPALIKTIHNIPLIGVLEPGARAAVQASKNGRIAVIATEATINSGAYQGLIQTLKPDAQVVMQACPLFVPLAEEGWLEDPVTITVAKHYLDALLEQHKPDTLVLGCTHFPALLPAISAVVHSSVQIIDSAHTTAIVVKNTLEKKGLLASSPLSIPTHFLVTDSPHRFHIMAKRFLNDDIDESQIEWVDGDFV
jgi:glutamate racemase